MTFKKMRGPIESPYQLHLGLPFVSTSVFPLSTHTMPFFIHCVDPSLGKVDKSSFSQETLMEILIADLEENAFMFGPKDDPRPIALWKGLRMEDETVQCIVWGVSNLIGSINLKYLPATVMYLELTGNHLTGSLDLKELSPVLQDFTFSRNEFTGDFNLTCLPDSFEHLDGTENQLSGSLNLEHLPQRLVTLSLAKNLFTGIIFLTKLPPSMSMLCINDNRLSGPIDVTSLPAGMRSLFVNQNAFEGKTDFSRLPKSLETLYVSHTKLSGEIYAKQWLIGGVERDFYVEESQVTIHWIEEGGWCLLS